MLFDARISSRITTGIRVVGEYQINYNDFDLVKYANRSNKTLLNAPSSSAHLFVKKTKMRAESSSMRFHPLIHRISLRETTTGTENNFADGSLHNLVAQVFRLAEH